MKTTLPLVLFAAAPLLAHGAGFQLQERSAAGLGRAFSGEAAMADDATIIASNPAGMMLLDDEWSFALGASGISPQVEVAGFYRPPGAPAGVRRPAAAGNVGDDALIPYAYAAKRLGERWSAGFGAFTSFGLNSDYPAGFPALGIADLGEVKTVTLNPSIAWRANSRWSVGLGYQALRAEGSLTSTFPNGVPVLDLGGNDWGHGFNAGLLFEATERTRVGLHYRSGIDLDLEGRAISGIPALNGPATLAVELPARAEISAVHDLGDWSIHGDIAWTDWSVFQQLAPRITGAPVQPPVTVENWKDSWRFAAGVTWRASERWTFRGGLAYDRSPVSEANLTLRIPDADRFWLSAGFSWEFSPCWTLDFGYAHVFADDVFITDGSAASGTFNGKASGSADVVSVGISAGF
jgi:long-chain fatty acid transport protein